MAVTISPNERLQHLFHPWTSYVIVPLFALANAGVELNSEALQRAASSPITIGILAGLVLGKIVGITGAAWLATRRRFGGLPLVVQWPHMVGVATVSGIGFTVSLLIADITFGGAELEEAKLGIFAASVIAALLAWIAFRVIGRLPQRMRFAGEGRIAPPLEELAEAVDPEIDHLRGPVDAPVTLVEYGDFECPYCGRAESVLRELVRNIGNDLTFVFRHLPLVDVHERAQLAAEASEAAGAQDHFWEMHDMLMDHQTALSEKDVFRYAGDLGLDIGGPSACRASPKRSCAPAASLPPPRVGHAHARRRGAGVETLEEFAKDIHERRHAARVERDVVSADESGAVGTPTFFVNGRRHQGALDLKSLTAAVNSVLAESVRSARSQPWQ